MDFFRMLSGRGERENRANRKAFKDAIPQNFPGDMTETERRENHPAYSGPWANTPQAASYQRAHGSRGPQSKAEHRALERHQLAKNPDGSWDDKPERRSVFDFLVELILP